MAAGRDKSTVRVLLVEDDPDDYYLTRDLLAEAAGKKIALDWAKDYESGLAAIESCDHDAYLLDYRLGKRDGLKLLSEALRLGCKAPMILLTGAGDRELALDALAAGAADYLVKGEIDAANLERSIRYSVQQARHAEELEEQVRRRTDELERANAALRDSQTQLQLVTDALPVLISYVDADRCYRFANKTYKTWFGRDPAEIVGLPMREVLGDEAYAAISPSLDRVFSGESVSFERLLHYKDGGARFVAANYVPDKDESGAVKGFYVLVENITERKRAEDARRESEERFARFMQYLPGLAWIKDIEGRYVYANDAAAKAFRTPRAKLYGRADDEVFPSDIARQFRENDELAVNRGKGVQTVEQLEQEDGTVRHSIVTKFPIMDPDGRTALIGGMAIDITDRMQAEEALRESEERRKLAQDAGNVGVFDWDIIADKTYWSETMWSFYGEESTGVNPDEKFWSDHIHGTDRDRVKSNIRLAVSSGSDRFADEFRIVRSDGTIRWIEATARISRDANGVATRMYGVNLDITHRKEAEETIRLNEYQLRMVTDTVPALIAYIDSSQRYRFVNQRYIDWFGKPREKIIGRTVAEIVGPQAYRAIRPRIEEALAGRECTYENELTMKGAGSRFVRVWYSPDPGIDGRVNGFYSLISDQTELKRSQDLLRSTEERIALIMESLTDYAIFSTDSEGRIESWNRGAESIYGYALEEIAGQSWEILFEPEDVARGVPLREMRTARQKGRAKDDRWHVKKDGSRFFAGGVVMPLYVGGALTGYAKVASDLTEKQRQADELQRAHDELEVRVIARTKELAETNLALLEEMEEREIAEKQRIDLLRRLVSSQESERRRIARDLHDTLGQRLTALRLKIASLRQAADGHKEFASRVERLQEISERLDSEVSFMAWELRPSALDDLGLAEAVGAFVSEWSKHYEIAADFHSGKLMREIVNRETETHLYRITQEALNNIAKHSGARSVSVLLERRENNLILIIEDDGKGFDPAKLSAPAESGKGLGLLGMSERATLVGGNVEIESAPGKGTTIYARVPFFAET